MSEVKTDLDGLSAAIEAELRSYTDAVQKEVAVATKQTADEALKEVKSRAPVRVRHSRGYAKSFRVTDTSQYGFIEYKIHNAKHWQLIHLLEKGHALRTGGRTRAFPHMKPAEESAETRLAERIIQILKG